MTTYVIKSKDLYVHNFCLADKLKSSDLSTFNVTYCTGQRSACKFYNEDGPTVAKLLTFNIIGDYEFKAVALKANG